MSIINFRKKHIESLRRAADGGDGESAYLLGEILWAGDDQTPADPAAARIAWVRAAFQGVTTAAFRLGETYLAEDDHYAARRWLHLAANDNLPPAQCALAGLLLDGLGGPSEPLRALELLEEASQADFPPALRAYGLALLQGVGGVPQPKLGLHYLRQGADAGDPLAMRQLGQILYGGLHGVPADPAKGRDWLTRAAERGDATAATLVAAAASQVDERQAALERAAGAGDVDAQVRLGQLYLDQGNPAAAREQWIRAVNQGDTRAMAQLSLLAWEGLGCPQDREVACQWAHRALCLSAPQSAGADLAAACLAYYQEEDPGVCLRAATKK